MEDGVRRARVPLRRKPVEYTEFDDTRSQRSEGGYSNTAFYTKYGAPRRTGAEESGAPRLPFTVAPPAAGSSIGSKSHRDEDDAKSQRSARSSRLSGDRQEGKKTEQEGKETESAEAKQQGEQNEFDKSYMDVIRDFADSTSFTGIPFINRAGRWYSKLSWLLVFLIALALWLFHSYYIIDEYLQYETTATTEIRYSQLAFPSVTLCNVNPVRESYRASYGSTAMNDFLDELAPSTDYQTRSPPDQGQPQGRRKRKKRQTVNNQEGQTNNQQGTNQGSGQNPGSSGNEEQYDQFRFDSARIDEDFGSGNVSEQLTIELDFKKHYGALPEEDRTAMGHQQDVFILSCSFNGRQCDITEDFVLEQTTDYGNCYTFNSHSQRSSAYKSQRSGALYGLDLQLYIEASEYVPGLKIERGVRMDVHSFDTVHNVAENGLSLSPGKQTFIGMTLTELKRLGGVFGDCDDDGSFRDYYGQRYTMEGCLNTCLDRSISSICLCHRESMFHKYIQADLDELPSCLNDSRTSACADAYELAFETGQLGCGCNPACKSREYDMLISSNNWPDSSLWFTLVDLVCNVDDDRCRELRQVVPDEYEDELKANFLNLKLYYRDLNYADVKQQANYEQSQFISDLGGAIGLWVGASMITLLELLDLSFQCCHFACRRNAYMSMRKEQLRRRKFHEHAAEPEATVNVDLSDPPSYRSTEGPRERPGLHSDTFI